MTRPPCSTIGIQPWRRSDGTLNKVRHIHLRVNQRVSDLIGQTFQTTKGEAVVVGFTEWQYGQPMPPILAIEADCNRGKSYAVHYKLLRERILAKNWPEMPMLHVSVRITHAMDLHKTCLKYYVEEMREDGNNTPISGMRLVCYNK